MESQEPKIGRDDVAFAIVLSAAAAAIIYVAAAGIQTAILGWREGRETIAGWGSIGSFLLSLLPLYLLWGMAILLLGAPAWWLLHRSGVRGAFASVALGAALPSLVVAVLFGLESARTLHTGRMMADFGHGFTAYWSGPTVITVALSGAAAGYAAWWSLYRRKKAHPAR